MAALRFLVPSFFAVAACTFSGAGSDITVDAGRTVDVDSGRSDAVIDAPPNPIDSDGDGLPDDGDNCPDIANPSQDNEDGDAFGNLCDGCPTIDDGQVAQVDGDGDGIGNGCDPQPGAINSWVFFEGFDTPIVPSEWAGEAVWKANLDEGFIERDSNAERSYLMRRNVGGDDDILVVAAMDFDNENNDGLPFRFGGVLVEGSSSGESHRGSWLIRNSNTNESFGRVSATAANGPFLRESIDADVVENRRYTFSHSVRGNEHISTIESVDGSQSVSSLSTNNFVGDDVGVVASFVTAKLYYLYAIRLVD